MIRGLYSAASGMVAATEQHEVTAYNLANSAVPGYRQRGVATESFDRILGRTAPRRVIWSAPPSPARSTIFVPAPFNSPAIR